MEYSWRFIAFRGFWRLFPFGFRESFVSLDERKETPPLLREILRILRNSLLLFIFFSIASWYNCIRNKSFYTPNPVWGLCILWIVYCLLRISWLNESFLILIKKKKLDAFKTPFSRRLLALFTVWTPLILVYVFYLEFARYRIGLPSKCVLAQFLYILALTLFFFLIWWYVVFLVRGIRGIRSERRFIRIVVANFLIFSILLYVFGDLWGKMALRFLRVGGGIEFSFRWNRKCGDRIPDEWMEAFCKTSPCRGKLILKTEEEVLLRSPSTKRYLSIPRSCIVEVPASEKTDS